eukprot:4888036-Pleurochrysis_carterae.AAC.1
MNQQRLGPVSKRLYAGLGSLACVLQGVVGALQVRLMLGTVNEARANAHTAKGLLNVANSEALT